MAKRGVIFKKRYSRRIKKLNLTKHTGSIRASHPTVPGSNWTAKNGTKQWYLSIEWVHIKYYS